MDIYIFACSLIKAAGAIAYQCRRLRKGKGNVQLITTSSERILCPFKTQFGISELPGVTQYLPLVLPSMITECLL